MWHVFLRALRLTRAAREQLGPAVRAAAESPAGACEIAIDGKCEFDPKMSNHGWFVDAALGPAGLMSDAACAARAAAWVGHCRAAAVRHRVVPASDEPDAMRAPLWSALPAVSNFTPPLLLMKKVCDCSYGETAASCEPRTPADTPTGDVDAYTREGSVLELLDVEKIRMDCAQCCGL